MTFPVHPLLWALMEPSLIVAFFLVVMRLTGLLMTAPLFNGSQIPAMVKVWLSMVLALVVVTSVLGWPPKLAVVDKLNIQTLPQLAFWMGWEFGIGWLIGTAARWLFESVRMAGEIIATQMGLSMASALDPTSGESNTVISESLSFMALLVFLSLDLHHWLIASVYHTYQWLPIGQLPNNTNWLGGSVDQLLIWFGSFFELGLMLAAPIMAMLLLTDMALAYVAKLMPQMNVFLVGLPLKLIVGLAGLSISASLFFDRINQAWNVSFKGILLLFKGLVA